MFFGLPNPDPSLFCTDPDLDPATFINTQKTSKKNIDLYYSIYDFYWTFYL